MQARHFDPAPNNLVLVGLRGCGKSSVGRLVARRLAWEFVDTDELIERKEGRTISAIFATDGEAGFREIERQAIEHAARGEHRVIAVGGGAVLLEANRRALRAAGLCVWLTAPPPELLRRLQADPHTATRRPALSRLPELAEIEKTLASRRPFYEALADQVLDTAGRTIADVAQEVITFLQCHLRPKEGS